MAADPEPIPIPREKERDFLESQCDAYKIGRYMLTKKLCEIELKGEDPKEALRTGGLLYDEYCQMIVLYWDLSSSGIDSSHMLKCVATNNAYLKQNGATHRWITPASYGIPLAIMINDD